MTTFLKEVAKSLLQRYPDGMAHLTIVFPNKRAALFLNQELAEMAGKPIWCPKYTTISDLFRQHSSLVVADPIKSICELHKSYMEVTGNVAETLDQFYGWGQLLLADFDDLDKNKGDAKTIFSNIKSLKELETIDYLEDDQKAEIRRFFSDFDDHPEGIRERFINFWDKLYDIYSNFKKRLRKENLAYEGMLYRDVIEQKVFENNTNQYVFVGFNVLQKVEQCLFSLLKEKGQALFYWDFDRYYLNSNNEAGTYLRQWIGYNHNKEVKYPNAIDLDNDALYDNLNKPKSLKYISAPTENLQARYISEWLKEDDRYKKGKRTAIVLCDEHLLQTVIHCIPKEVDTLNVTTGFPLQQALITSMVNQLLTLQLDGYSTNEQSFRLHYLNRVLRHPYGKYLIDGVDELYEQINQKRQFYVKPTTDFILSYHPSDKAHLPALVKWLTDVVQTIGINGAADQDPLFQESVFRMYTLLNRLTALIDDNVLDADRIIFRRLLTQLIASTTIPFHGEPARGIQIMGVLETRNLDFDHVLILSCNEGNMPKGVDDSSFIPHLLRKAYGLTTIDNKVSVYSYYFHAIIQRSKDVTILYNNAPQGVKSGEMSRFMTQLMVEWQYPIMKETLKAGQNPMRLEPKAVVKDNHIIDRLLSFKRFSPTAINTYTRCPLRFYYKYIAQIVEPDELENDDIDGRLFGNIFHHAAQSMYENLLPRDVITANDIDFVLKTKQRCYANKTNSALKNLDNVVDEAFSTQLFNLRPGTLRHPKLNGLQLINKEVITTYLLQLLRIDRRSTPIRILDHEFDIQRKIDIKVGDKLQTIIIGGRVDRLDEINCDKETARLRVVDYKTGNAVAKNLTDISEAFESKSIQSKKSDYSMQAILYSLIEAEYDSKHNPQKRAVSPALLFIQHAGREEYSPILSLGKDEITDVVSQCGEEFYAALTSQLEEIHNPQVDFYPTENLSMCKFCPYKQMCGR